MTTTDFTLDSTCKSYPITAAPCRVSEIAARGWNVLADDLAFSLSFATVNMPALTTTFFCISQS